MENTKDLIVFSKNKENIPNALLLAERINASEKLTAHFTSDEQTASGAGLVLRFDSDGLSLTDNKLVLKADLTSMLPRIKRGVIYTELLVRAAKIRHRYDDKNTASPLSPEAIDATAGFGEDSLLLAAAGFSVTLYEQDPVIAALLEDALNRASKLPELSDIARRMKLICDDSISALGNLERVPDVIYLDPMFPKRTKSALIKKKFQLLQQLESPCDNEEELLRAALDARPRKVVVKRPAKGPCLAGIKPSYSIPGKAVRYDVFVF